jgi:hypothetical protein
VHVPFAVPVICWKPQDEADLRRDIAFDLAVGGQIVRCSLYCGRIYCRRRIGQIREFIIMQRRAFGIVHMRRCGYWRAEPILKVIAATAVAAK